MDDKYYILKCANTDVAISCDKKIKNVGILCTIVSTPIAICDGCGLSLKIEKSNIREVKDILHNEISCGKYTIYLVSVSDDNKYEYRAIN